MEVKLLQSSHISIIVKAIRMCWQSQDKSDSFTYLSKDLREYNQEIYVLGDKDKKLIQTVINKSHTSTLEHCHYSFEITGISRLVLQEHIRHRISSSSVKSSRYTLKEIKDEPPFIDDVTGVHWQQASKYINLIGDELIDFFSVKALDNVRELVYKGYANDKIKSCLPECYKTDLIWSVNARSIRNFLSLRTDKSAHFEIQTLANAIYKQIPDDHKFLYEGCIKN